jgi:hypothetical protein
MCWLIVAPWTELTLPTYSDSSTQIVGDFLKELEIYCYLKTATVKLRFPLAPREIRDSFAKGLWNTENHKLGAYENLKEQITQLI